MLALLHVLDRRDPRFHFVSEYAFSHPLLMGLVFTTFGGAGLAFVPALRRARPGWRSSACGVLLVIFAAGMVLLALFPTDHEGVGPATTSAGRIHDGASGVVLLALFGAMVLAWSAASPHRGRALVIVVAAVTAAAVVPVLIRPTWVGVHQRVLFGSLVVTFLVLARALRQSDSLDGVRSFLALTEAGSAGSGEQGRTWTRDDAYER